MPPAGVYGEFSRDARGVTRAKYLRRRTGGPNSDTQTVEELAETLEVTLGCTVVGQGFEWGDELSKNPSTET